MKAVAFTIGVLATLTPACGAASGSLGAAPTGVPTSLASGPGRPPTNPAPVPAPIGPPGPGTRPSTVPPTAVANAIPATPAPSTVPAGPHPTRTVEVWLVRNGRLYVTPRQVPVPAVARAALTAMLIGPSAAESAAGIRSAIPDHTTLLGVTIAGGTATVDLSSTFESSATGSAMPLRLAQVVYTATQFPTVTKVLFRIDGQGRTRVGGVRSRRPRPATSTATISPPSRSKRRPSASRCPVRSPCLGPRPSSKQP